MVTQIKPQLPKGMRDFLPADILKRQYVIDTISNTFETFGFEPLQTPVLELSQTLMGKYGPDAEKLIFYAQHPGGEEKLALRYDLTVPLARAFGMNEARLNLPFRRYQIAPVWRAERPQRGRFREFFQCDADIVGISGKEADAEVVALAVTALRRLGFTDFAVKLNSRRLLTGIGMYAGLTGEPLSNLYRSIDKLDKIGINGVKEELTRAGIEANAIARIIEMIGTTRHEETTGYEVAAVMLGKLREALADIPTAQEGLEELDQIIDFLAAMQVPGQFIEVDFSMVRGLSYYTGSIYEAVISGATAEERVGSIAGGGRYDDLVGLFRKESLPTVGISLGIERLIVLMEQRNLYPPGLRKTVVQALVTVFAPETRVESMALAAELRAANFPTELFLQDAKLGKQLAYADKKGIPFVLILGPDEIASGLVKVRDLRQQAEVSVARNDIVTTLQALSNPSHS